MKKETREFRWPVEKFIAKGVNSPNKMTFTDKKGKTYRGILTTKMQKSRVADKRTIL